MICTRGSRLRGGQGGDGAGRGGEGRLSEDFPVLGGLGAGSQVGGYRVERPLGAGGMAVVYRARDERLGRLVALKVLAPALAADGEFRRRFTAESRAAAAVDHPHIIPVYDAGQAGGALFIAMRLVTGGDLRQVLDREGPLPPGRAAQFLSPVASALDAAHRAGLVHRDVKPANILVDAEPDRPDHVYLSDFGISKGAVSSAGLTGTGQYLGTPEYTSPEQVKGLAVDGRADQYALACVAWHLLTGTVPFQRDQGLAVLLAHLTEPPPVAALRPRLPAGAGQVLARALAKEPGERYPSCGEFADALRDALALQPYRPAVSVVVAPAAAGHPRTEVSGPPADSAPVTVTAGTASEPDGPGGPGGPGGLGLDPGAPAVTDGRTQDIAAPEQRLLPGPGPGSSHARSARRRRYLVITLASTLLAAAAAAIALWLTRPTAPQLTGTLATILSGPAGQDVRAVAFAPGGMTLAVGDSSGSTYLWDTATGKLTATLTDPVPVLGVDAVAFSPDGTTLAAGDGNGSTYVWDTATGKLTATLTDPGGNGVTAVAFGPGGTTLAAGDQNGSTYVWDTATGKLTATLTDPGGNAVDAVAFGPGGATLAAGDQNGSTYLWDTATATIIATFTGRGGRAVDAVAFAPGGATLATGDQNGSTYLWDTVTSKLTATLTATPTGPVPVLGVDAVAFAPDGTTLATGDGNGSTYLWDTATGKLTATLTDPAGNAVDAAAFAPGGTPLATGDQNGSTYLWRISSRSSRP